MEGDMDTALLISIFSVISAGLGVLISWLVFSKQKKKDTEKVGEDRGVMASDIGYIKAGVDDLKRETRETRHDMGELSTRVARCEESCKQAHKRIDEIHHYERIEKE
jgi:hypothetical protein